jgi:PBSX family phage terminase large subunit
MNLGEKQRQSLIESNRRINIWWGTIRSGKTFVSILRWLEFIGRAPRGALIMTGKTVNTLKRNIIDPMFDLLGGEMAYYSGNHIIKLWGKTIYCFGADNESSEGKIRGMTVAGAYQDEITLSPISYFKTTLGRMSPEGAKYFGSTNPDSLYHPLKVEYLDKKGLDLIQFPFLQAELENNPALSEEFKTNIKKEYVGLWKRRFIDGLWVLAEGAIHDYFDESIHTAPLAYIQKHFFPDAFAVAVDYGTAGTTVFILFGISHNPLSWWKVVALKEYVYDAEKAGKQKTDLEFAEDMKAWLGPKIKPIAVIVDPSANSLQLQLRKTPFNYNVIDAQNSIIDGLRKQATMLKGGEYILCREGCPRTIQDYSGYVWDKKAQLRGEDMPAPGPAEHSADCQRYFIYTTFGGSALDLRALTTL